MKQYRKMILMIGCIAMTGCTSGTAGKAKALPTYAVSTEDSVVYDYDAVYQVSYPDPTESQKYIDAGYLTYLYGDFYHHNTEILLKNIFTLKPGDELIIDKKTYVFDYMYEEGQVYNDKGEETGGSLKNGGIKGVDGNIVENDGIPQIITCSNDEGGRYIAYMHEVTVTD